MAGSFLKLQRVEELTQFLKGKRVLGLGLGLDLQLAILTTEPEHWDRFWGEVRQWRRENEHLSWRFRPPLTGIPRSVSIWSENRAAVSAELPISSGNLSPTPDGYLVTDQGFGESRVNLLDRLGFLSRSLVVDHGLGDLTSAQMDSDGNIWLSYGEQSHCYRNDNYRLTKIDQEGNQLFRYDEDFLNCDHLNVTRQGIWFSKDSFSDRHHRLVHLSLDARERYWKEFPRPEALLFAGEELMFISHGGECTRTAISHPGLKPISEPARLTLPNGTLLRDLHMLTSTSRGNRFCLLLENQLYDFRLE